MFGFLIFPPSSDFPHRKFSRAIRAAIFGQRFTIGQQKVTVEHVYVHPGEDNRLNWPIVQAEVRITASRFASLESPQVGPGRNRLPTA